MQNVPIQALPNQQFSVVLDGNQWNIAIRATNGVMSVSFTLNSVLILENARAVAGELIIPSQYEEAGNFLFLTLNNDLPDYTKFGTSQSMVYASASELAVLRQAVAPPITAADFNPIADLPLRFDPQGYLLA